MTRTLKLATDGFYYPADGSAYLLTDVPYPVVGPQAFADRLAELTGVVRRPGGEPHPPEAALRRLFDLAAWERGEHGELLTPRDRAEWRAKHAGER